MPSIGEIERVDIVLRTAQTWEHSGGPSWAFPHTSLLYVTRRPHAAPATAHAVAGQAADDDVEDGDDTVDDGLDNAGNAVDDGHESRADGLEDRLDLLGEALARLFRKNGLVMETYAGHNSAHGESWRWVF